MPLFVFMAGSPFFLKNFMHTLGTFRHLRLCVRDLACCCCRRARLFLVLLAALASMILILIHHIHLLMYVPTIAVIVGAAFTISCTALAGKMRSPEPPRSRASAVLFFAAQFRGSLAYPKRSSSSICKAAWPTLPGPTS